MSAHTEHCDRVGYKKRSAERKAEKLKKAESDLKLKEEREEDEKESDISDE